MDIYFNNESVIQQVRVANNFVKKFFGLMGKRSMNCYEGLLLLNCSSIHCFFMKIPIDAVYLSKDLEVLAIETIKPWHVGRSYKDVRHVLELEVGIGHKKFSVGDQLILCP